MKTTVKDITQHLESMVPLSLQESYDNTGLIVGNPDAPVNRILLCLDSTEEVIVEAIQKNCEMVIAHHPIVFRGLKKLNGTNYVERTVMTAIKHDIAIYAMHTNLDNVDFGVNEKIMHKLGIKSMSILSLKDKREERIGAGMIGTLDQSLKEQEFLEMLKVKMNVGCIKHTKLLGKEISRVAICGGAGSFLLPKAIEREADIFITSDFTYHQFFDAEDKIVIADIGHYESEQFTSDVIRDVIFSDKFMNLDIIISSINTNPVHYL